MTLYTAQHTAERSASMSPNGFTCKFMLLLKITHATPSRAVSDPMTTPLDTFSLLYSTATITVVIIGDSVTISDTLETSVYITAMFSAIK